MNKVFQIVISLLVVIASIFGAYKFLLSEVDIKLIGYAQAGELETTNQSIQQTNRSVQQLSTSFQLWSLEQRLDSSLNQIYEIENKYLSKSNIKGNDKLRIEKLRLRVDRLSDQIKVLENN